MAKARKKKEAPTELQQQETAVVAHLEQVAEHLPAEQTAEPDIFDRAATTSAAGQFESSEPTPTPDTAVRVAAAMQAAPTVFRGSELEAPEFIERDWSKFADPARRNSLLWPDGYKISVQESKKRGTVEIQFGDGSTRDKPQNFAAIKPVMQEAGLSYNGTNAWAIELHQPPMYGRESHAERLERIEANKAIRTRIEDELFPAIVVLEEQARGEIPLTDETRERITKAAEGHHR